MKVLDCYGSYAAGNIAAERDCRQCLQEEACIRASRMVSASKTDASSPLDQIERDPFGLDPHAPGAKLDGEKVMAELMIDGFSRALLAVAEVSTYGARKYSPGGWQHVPEGVRRYRGAGDRHRLFRGHDTYDRDSGLLHLAHEAWNRLAELELMLRVEQSEEGEAPMPDEVVQRPAETRSVWHITFRSEFDGRSRLFTVGTSSEQEALASFRASHPIAQIEGVRRAK